MCYNERGVIVMTKKFSEIDKNLAVSAAFNEPDMKVYNIRENDAFSIHGLYNPKTETVFRRLPADAARKVSENVETLSLNTAGGRVRFRTNSEYIGIKCVMPEVNIMPHMPATGSSGFDMYVKRGGREVYEHSFVPPWGNFEGGYESVCHFKSEEMREVTINFPLYNKVDDLYIILSEKAELLPPLPYTFRKPVVFYGSSITQGGCASRPGNCYASMVSQRLDCDYINLGFSGSARGEDAIIDYISSLDMSVFVYDYDYNAPDAEHLEKTHERGFLRFREKNPDVPVIFASAPTIRDGNPPFGFERRQIIFNTYANAMRRGDGNVFFIDGAGMFAGEFPRSCTVDGTHPNDIGFLRMYGSFVKYIELAINKSAT